MLSADADLERAREECERHAWSLLALQAPVAGGLWTILAAVYAAKKIERMGGPCRHIADTARLAHPAHAIPTKLAAVFTGMSSTV